MSTVGLKSESVTDRFGKLHPIAKSLVSNGNELPRILREIIIYLTKKVVDEIRSMHK